MASFTNIEKYTSMFVSTVKRAIDDLMQCGLICTEKAIGRMAVIHRTNLF